MFGDNHILLWGILSCCRAFSFEDVMCGVLTLCGFGSGRFTYRRVFLLCCLR